MFSSVIKNDKGGILVITIVSMMILTIIGYVTLQMLSKQNTLDIYDQAKLKTDYYAEGIVEKARGYIDYVVERNMEFSPDDTNDYSFGDIGDNHAGYLYTVVANSPESGWKLFNETAASQPADDGDYGAVDPNIPVDDSYPKVYASVYCKFVNEDEGGIEHKTFVQNVEDDQTYKLVGVASTTLNVAGGSLVISTVTYYFRTHRDIQDGVDVPYASGMASVSGYAAQNVKKSPFNEYLFMSSTSGSTSGSAVGARYSFDRVLIGWRKS